ncbi:helix-turn-helix transcriptional regulator [Flavobacterium cheonhonense]|jgi:transcriptional regulator with XRE-family HTH domain|uniref:Helix-turn-helix transcriptional regulator n=1 Tax=Flavobacterium cheonhonense TaxID=706185 RepID=A0ABP7T9V9_9FLAO|nr:helix-turn-helix transcriptional regulator [Flavobacterium cheonhonense]
MKTSAKPSHIGRKISKIRELRGMKQEALALAIGVSQQTISNIENSEEVEEEVLVKIAEALEVSVEGIKNFNEDIVLNIISNTFRDNSSVINYGCTFNPIDKVVELYDKLLASEKEKFEYLEKLFKDKL